MVDFINDHQTYDNPDSSTVAPEPNLDLLDPLTDKVLAIVRAAFPNIDAIYTEAQIREFAREEAQTKDDQVIIQLTSDLNNYKNTVDQQMLDNLNAANSNAQSNDDKLEIKINEKIEQASTKGKEYVDEKTSDLKNHIEQEDATLNKNIEQGLAESKLDLDATKTDLNDYKAKVDYTLKEIKYSIDLDDGIPIKHLIIQLNADIERCCRRGR